MISIIVISILGTILHFTYEFSNYNKFVGIISAVNESTWEHIKMGLTASLFYSIPDTALYIKSPNYLFAKFISLLIIIILIPLIFYGCKLIIKKQILLMDILNFYFSIIVSRIVFYKLLSSNIQLSIIGLIGIIIIIISYSLFTLYPPKIFLFKDPITNKYGMLK